MAEKTTTVKSVTKEEPAVKAAAAETKAPEGKEEAKKEAKKEEVTTHQPRKGVLRHDVPQNVAEPSIASLAPGLIHAS